MFHARLLNMSVICMAMCSCLSACGGGGGKGGGDKGPVTRANFDKILADGSGNLAAVETIMGGKGTELPKETWKKHEINPNALPFKGKIKVVKVGDELRVMPDDEGTEVKVVRWGDDSKYIYVAVAEDKVVWKGLKEN
jgi:hypothetical protein